MERYTMMAAMAGAFLILGSSSGAAQVAWEWPAERTEASCAGAEDFVSSAPRSSERREANRYLATCGPRGGVALAAQLRQSRGVSDLEALDAIYEGATRILDREVYQAAMDVAADPSASIEARVFAWKTLISYKNGHLSVPFANFLPGRRQAIAVQDHHVRHEGATLPPGWEREAAGMAARVAEDRSETEVSRYAARRALRFLD